MVVVGVGVVGVEGSDGCGGDDRIARVCGGTVGTVNIGSRAPVCPPFIVVLRERGHSAIQGKCPRSGRGSDWFSNPEITFLTIC
jgi:hypothetical protein